METSLVQSLKMAIVQILGLSKDALHVYVGLAVFFLTAAVTRKAPASWTPWLAVVAVALLGELFDLRDNLASLGYWHWGASLRDLVNTIFWPTLLLLLTRKGFFTLSQTEKKRPGR